MIRTIGRWTLVMVLIIPLSGCSMAFQPQSKARINDDELFPAVREMIEEQQEVVMPYLGEEIERVLGRGMYDADQVVEQTLGELQGREYLEFCYVVGHSESEEDVQKVVSFAHGLLDEAQRLELDMKLEQTRSLLMAEAEVHARALAPSQRAPFWKDMQKLVTRTLVLFTAGVVYACIPKVVFWGKVSAATAIAVATGVVASSVMSIWRYYQFGEVQIRPSESGLPV